MPKQKNQNTTSSGALTATEDVATQVVKQKRKRDAADMTSEQNQKRSSSSIAPKPKQHRNRPDLANFGAELTKPGDNSRYIRYAMASLDLPAIDISDPQQVKTRIRDYFNYCADNDRKPNIKGLGNWLGVSDDTVIRWRKGDYRAETHCEVIKKAVDLIQEMWWDYGHDGKCNPASWIFIGKNAFGMKDMQDVVITPNNLLQNLDNDTAKNRLLEATAEDE